MKFPLLILCCFLSFYGHCQSIYTSSFTQTWPTIFNSRVEEVNKTISFEDNTITLATETPLGKEFELFYIQRISENNGATQYFCLNSKEQPITVILPSPENLRFIDIYRPSLKTREEVQYRLHLN